MWDFSARAVFLGNATFEPNGTGVLDFYMFDGHLAYAAAVGTLQNVTMCPTTTL